MEWKGILRTLMEKEETLRKELQETERQLRAVEVEIERMAQQIPTLEERVRFAEQKNVQEQTKMGIDAINVQPSKEVREANNALEESGKVLEKLTRKKGDVLARIESIEVSLLETELVHYSRLFATLKEQEVQLEEELKLLRHEIEKAEKKKEEIALQVARKTQDKE